MAENEGLRKTGEARIVSIFPDVCYTPPLCLPVPYNIYAVFSDGIRCADSVRMTEQSTMTVNSRLTTVYGDEPGIWGGIISGVNKGWCRSLTHSKNVRAEGKNINANSSYYLMNCDGPDGLGNTIGVAIFLEEAYRVRIGSDGEMSGNTDPPVAHEEVESEEATKAEGFGLIPYLEALLPDVSYAIDREVGPIFVELGPFGIGGTLENRIKIIGEASASSDDSLNPMIISDDGVDVEVSNQNGGITTSSSVGVDSTGQVSGSSSVEGQYGGSTITFKPPSTIAYSYNTSPIEGKFAGVTYSGQGRFEIETVYHPPDKNKLIGAGIVVAAAAATIYIIANDVTIVGILDDIPGLIAAAKAGYEGIKIMAPALAR